MGSRDAFVNAVKQGYVSVSTKAVMTVLVTKLPFLSHPWLYKIAEKLIKDLNLEVAERTEIAIFFQYIDTRVHGQGTEWAAEAVKNWQIQNSNATDEEKRRAEEEFFAAHKRLVKFNS